MKIHEELKILINEYIETASQMDKDIREGKEYLSIQNATFTNGATPVSSFQSIPQRCLSALEKNTGTTGGYAGGMIYLPDYQPTGNYFMTESDLTNPKTQSLAGIENAAEDYAINNNYSSYAIGEKDTVTDKTYYTYSKGMWPWETKKTPHTEVTDNYSYYFGEVTDTFQPDTGCTGSLNPYGCKGSAQIWSATNNPNCNLYPAGKGQTPSWKFNTGLKTVAYIPVIPYYEEKLTDISDKIQSLIDNEDKEIASQYANLMSEMNNSTNYTTFFEKVSFQKKQLEIFGKKYNLINEQYNISYDKLQSENLVFRLWFLVLLFVLSIIFYLFPNPVKSFSYVCVFFIFVIIISILKMLKPVLFMILLMILFMVIVLGLFYKEKYTISIGILVIGSFIFALIYRL